MVSGMCRIYVLERVLRNGCVGMNVFIVCVYGNLDDLFAECFYTEYFSVGFFNS